MKKIFGLVALLITGAFAATSALYLHHERSTQATVEADCQNRELCLDKVNLAPLGRFNDGTLWHGVTQEKPNVNLTGTLTVTGATVLSNNLTLSLFATGRIPYTTTAGLLTSGTGLTYNGSAFSVTGTGAFSGAVTMSSTLGVTGGNLTVGSNANSYDIIQNGPTANNRNYFWQTGGLNRWKIFTNSTAESGSNAGSDFGIAAYNDAGSFLSNALIITRSNRTAAFNDNVTVGGTLGVTGVTTATGGLNLPLATASLPLFTDGSKNAVSNSMTGTGSVMMSASPTTTGTLTAAAVTTSGLITANGGIQSVASVASSFYETGTFTMSINGFSACTGGTLNAGKCEATASYVKVGKMVTLLVPVMYGTSNTTTMEIAGIPAIILAASNQAVSVPSVTNNGSVYVGGIIAGANGANTILYQSAVGTLTYAYTNSGTKGFQNAISISYSTF